MLDILVEWNGIKQCLLCFFMSQLLELYTIYCKFIKIPSFSSIQVLTYLKKRICLVYLLHNLLYMEIIYIFTFYLLTSYLSIIDTNYIIYKLETFFFQRTTFCERKYISF